MAAVPVYIQIEPELTSVLEDSEKLKRAVLQELRKDGIEAEISWKPDPTSTEPDRDLVLVILAVGAAALMVGSAVKRVIDAYNPGHPTILTTRELTPALDGQGNAIRDRVGNPVYTSKETPSAFTAPQESDTTGLKVGTLFEIQSSGGKAAEQGKSS